ncbi:Alpha-monoglucosyldiacylglycerol synthase [Thalassoglobus neptunius]|uniref:Alpha-monoglucosyldiacylglycerol synthase n=1 Tax=Thalassoglobus neptunius TaxID=1938619 RepID=A0A5C5X458_9PLAN|nr:glycosyltransferase [Thalassoglobus neptunius]TWT56922.1 Alpha-monoglucosyldiacylglycerol synthase [Thalassoglobus neptunius]
MNILMLTNVYTPQIGGVTRSIEQFAEGYRQQGHDVLIVAPDYEENPDPDPGVVRVPAIPNFYEGRYSLPIPVMPLLIPQLRPFQPDIIHAHHPFLLGSTAQSLAIEFRTPLVYTHHTRYSVYIEEKTDWPHSVEEAIGELITGFCELVDQIIVPSSGIQELLGKRGIRTNMEVVPTGVDIRKFDTADGARFREEFQIDPEKLIVGHVGRLSVEKNCRFLTEVLCDFLKTTDSADVLIVGDGPEREPMEKAFANRGLSERVVMTGFLTGQELVDAYAAMDVFPFASHSETQGMVLGEAMAAGTPVVAIAATGVNDIVSDQQNGFLVPSEDLDLFCAQLQHFAKLNSDEREKLEQAAIETAREFSQQQCVEKMLSLYESLVNSDQHTDRSSGSPWGHMQEKWDSTWKRWRNRSRAVATLAREAMAGTSQPDSSPDATDSHS